MKHGRRIAIALGVCALATARPAAAQETVEALVAAALERSPEIRAARTALAAAGGQVTQAGLRPNPTMSASHLQMSGAQHETLVGIEWPLDLSRRPARVAAAQYEVEATEHSIEDQERLLVSRVRTGAGQLLAARRAVEVMSEALITARRMRELLDSKVNEGDIRKLDANIAAVEVGRMEADLMLAQADADAIAVELRALVGVGRDAPLLLRESLETLARVAPPSSRPSSAPLSLPSSLPLSPPDAQPGPAPTTVLAMRSDIREAAARVVLADARVEEARSAGRMDMALSGTYGHEFFGFAQRGLNDQGTLVPIEGSFNSVTFGATVMLPVRNGNQGAVATAQAARTGARELLAVRQIAAESELDAAVIRDREARRAVEMYATTIREQARQNVDVELEAYDLGQTALSEVLTEQRRYLDVEAAYTTVLQRAYDAQVALRRARGEGR